VSFGSTTAYRAESRGFWVWVDGGEMRKEGGLVNKKRGGGLKDGFGEIGGKEGEGGLGLHGDEV